MLPGRKYTIEDVLRIAWRRRWLIVLPTLVFGAVAVVAAKRLPNMYRSETLILVVPQKVPESYVRSTVSGTIEDRLPSLQEQILSRSRLERIIFDLNLYGEARRTRSLDSVVSAMRSAVKVEVVRNGEAFTVAFEHGDPQVAKTVTERLASLFIEENVHDRETLAVGTSDFLQTELDEARRHLVEQERRLETYRLKYAGQLPTQADFNLQAMQSTRTQLQSDEAELSRSHERQSALERQLADLLTPDAATAQASAAPVAGETAATDPLEPVGSTAREQLADGRRKLLALQARGLKPEHPDVARLQRRLAQIEPRAQAEAAAAAKEGVPPPAVDPAGIARERRVREIRIDLDAVTREITALETHQRQAQAEMADYQSRLNAVPLREAELTELMRDYDTLQQIYRGLLAKREDSKMAANLEQRQVGQQFRILDAARVPHDPVSPNRPLIELGGIAGGLVLGLGIGALLEYLDMTVKTEEEVRAMLALPVIATIPILPGLDAPRSLPMRMLATLRGDA